MKKFLALVLALVMVFALCACGQTATTTTEAATTETATTAETETAAEPADEPVELIVGGVTSQSAKDAVIYFGEKVAEYSNGTVTIQDFPDNILGDDAARWEMTQTGECDISIGSTSSVSTSFNDFFIYDIPFFFLSKQEVYDVGFGGEAGQTILAELEDVGLKGLCFYENGFRNLTTNDTPVNCLADIEGLKIRTMENPIHLAAWKAMGANPTPMSFSELFTAMQQGTVDGEENPIGIITGNSFQDVEKYCMLTEHVYTPYYVVMNLDRWNSLSAAQQEAVTKAIEESALYQYEQSQKYEDEGVAVMEAAGCTVITFTEEQKLEFKEAADSADCISIAKEKMTNPELADLMSEELAAYRG